MAQLLGIHNLPHLGNLSLNLCQCRSGDLAHARVDALQDKWPPGAQHLDVQVLPACTVPPCLVILSNRRLALVP